MHQMAFEEVKQLRIVSIIELPNFLFNLLGSQKDIIDSLLMYFFAPYEY